MARLRLVVRGVRFSVEVPDEVLSIYGRSGSRLARREVVRRLEACIEGDPRAGSGDPSVLRMLARECLTRLGWV